MNAQQFDTIAKILRSHGPSLDAARLVLIEGVRQSKAGRLCGVGRSSVSGTVRRIRAWHETLSNLYHP